MRLKLFLIAALAIFHTIPAQAQQSVCDLFKDLESHDGAQVVLRGELFLDGERAALAATECEARFIFDHMVWPTAIELRPSGKVPKNQLFELKNRAAEIKKLVAENRTLNARGTFSGRLTLRKRDMHAELLFDDARDITVEALPEASKLPVIPICDLFQDLPKYKGQRIAVRAEIVGTMEGTWLSGHCKSNFVTDGHRWPVALWYAGPDYYGAQPESLFRIDLNKTALKPPADPELKDRQNVITTGTFVGRLQMRDKYVGLCRTPDDYIANGFGHLGAAAAELIVESAFDATVAPSLAQTDQTEPEQACEPSNHLQLCAASTTLVDAAINNCADRIRALLAANGVDSKDRGPSASLTAAIRNGNNEVALLLIKASAPVNPVTTDDWSQPLLLAAHWDRIPVLQALVEAGGDVNRKYNGGSTLLVNEGVFRTRVSKILLDAGADPNGRDSSGATALMHASGQGYEEEIQLLLEHHADVNLKDAKGRTALMYAAESQYVDAIPLLLAHGADPLWRDNDGLTALDLAKKSGNTTSVQLLSAR